MSQCSDQMLSMHVVISHAFDRAFRNTANTLSQCVLNMSDQTKQNLGKYLRLPIIMITFVPVHTVESMLRVTQHPEHRADSNFINAIVITYTSSSYCMNPIKETVQCYRSVTLIVFISTPQNNSQK